MFRIVSIISLILSFYSIVFSYSDQDAEELLQLTEKDKYISKQERLNQRMNYEQTKENFIFYQANRIPLNNPLKLSLLFPGLGQRKCKSNVKSNVFIISELAAIGSSIYFIIDATKSYRNYETENDYTKMQNYWEETKRSETFFIISLCVAGGVWLANVIDIPFTVKKYNELLKNGRMPTVGFKVLKDEKGIMFSMKFKI